MDAQLIIESDEAVRLAEELAAMTGRDVGGIVTDALRVYLERQKRIAHILEVAAEVRSHLTEPLPTSDHSWLYGDGGLPA